MPRKRRKLAGALGHAGRHAPLRPLLRHGTVQGCRTLERFMHFRVGPIVLILVGILFLLNNLGLFHLRDLFHQMGTWWPVILIVIGAAGLIGGKR